MVQKTPHKRENRQRKINTALRFIVLILEGNFVILQFDDAAIADAHAKNIIRQIFDGFDPITD